MYLVRVMIAQSGFIFRAIAVTWRAVSAFGMVMTTTRAPSMPAWERTPSCMASPKKIGSPLFCSSRTVFGLSSIAVYGISALRAASATCRPIGPNPTMMMCPSSGAPVGSAARAASRALSRPGRGRRRMADVTRGADAMTNGATVIVPTDTARKTCSRSGLSRPYSIPGLERMKANSPIWPMASPVRTMFWRDTPAGMTAMAPMTALRMMMPMMSPAIGSACAAKKPVLRSIPIETKKKLVKMSRKGMIVERAALLYSDSDMIRPARKAPRARERPARDVSHAVPRQRVTTVIRKSSRLRRLAIR